MFAWELDIGASPAWQVGVYYLMLVLFLSLTFVVALWHPSPLGEWFRRVALALAVIVPVAVFACGWVTGGAYIGFRDERTFDLVVVSVSSFVLIWATFALPYAAALHKRVFLIPMFCARSFLIQLFLVLLNAHLKGRCLERMDAQLRGHTETIGQRDGAGPGGADVITVSSLRSLRQTAWPGGFPVPGPVQDQRVRTVLRWELPALHGSADGQDEALRVFP